MCRPTCKLIMTSAVTKVCDSVIPECPDVETLLSVVHEVTTAISRLATDDAVSPSTVAAR